MEKIGKKLKHDHTLTSILKFAIFSMVMLAPIFSVASRCLYVICNKNAKDSYSADNQIVEQLPISTPSVLISGVNYNVQLHNSTNRQNSYVIKYTYCSLIEDLLEAYPSYTDLLSCNEFLFREGADLTGNFISFRNSGQYLTHSTFTYEQLPKYSFIFTCNGITASTLSNTFNANTIYQNVLVDNSTLDNAFEYSLNQLEESSYYNWATNLGIYTPINNMVSGLGGHSIISLLLAYWSIYTAIYIVFDIIITCFVKITHLIQGE